MAPVSLDYLNVRIFDPTVCVEILAEIGACYGLVQLTSNQRLIGPANHPIRVGVAYKETKLDVPMRLSITVDILRMESYNLCAGHPGELCGHAVAAEGNGSYRGRAA